MMRNIISNIGWAAVIVIAALLPENANAQVVIDDSTVTIKGPDSSAAALPFSIS
ncbi:MAG: hypothetical protein H7259_08655, partial [Cytophagales bacterium]|nr:hypothetical protein [Cytophaga sp.]